jgi:hypothetical protein
VERVAEEEVVVGSGGGRRRSGEWVMQEWAWISVCNRNSSGSTRRARQAFNTTDWGGRWSICVIGEEAWQSSPEIGGDVLLRE